VLALAPPELTLKVCCGLPSLVSIPSSPTSAFPIPFPVDPICGSIVLGEFSGGATEPGVEEPTCGTIPYVAAMDVRRAVILDEMRFALQRVSNTGDNSRG
jgi:hypothetical protein